MRRPSFRGRGNGSPAWSATFMFGTLKMGVALRAGTFAASLTAWSSSKVRSTSRTIVGRRRSTSRRAIRASPSSSGSNATTTRARFFRASGTGILRRSSKFDRGARGSRTLDMSRFVTRARSVSQRSSDSTETTSTSISSVSPARGWLASICDSESITRRTHTSTSSAPMLIVNWSPLLTSVGRRDSDTLWTRSSRGIAKAVLRGDGRASSARRRACRGLRGSGQERPRRRLP